MHAVEKGQHAWLSIYPKTFASVSLQRLSDMFLGPVLTDEGPRSGPGIVVIRKLGPEEPPLVQINPHPQQESLTSGVFVVDKSRPAVKNRVVVQQQ